jgi:hypothetical protein
MTDRYDARTWAEAWGLAADPACETGLPGAGELARDPVEDDGPRDGDARDPEADELVGGSGEVWIAPQAGVLTRVRKFRLRRVLRERLRAECVPFALLDARMDARGDARMRMVASPPARRLHSFDGDLEILHGYVDAFHPHGEALRPGAQRLCTEREKHAFGGTHPHDFSEHRWNYGGRDAC